MNAPGDPTELTLSPIKRAVADLARGRPVIVTDDADRENEGDLVIAAAHATSDTIGLMVRYGSGVVCAPMLGADLDRLGLPPMVAHNEDPKTTAYAVSVDARNGTTTGISAADRATTLSALADPATRRTDLQRPGHVFPLRAVPGGVLVRRGHTEAAVDLCALAGLTPVSAICELVNDDGSIMRGPAIARFAHRRELSLISIADLVDFRLRTEATVIRAAETVLPTKHGRFRVFGYQSAYDASVEAVALVYGDLSEDQAVLVRVHSECMTGDVFSSHRCDCGRQLESAMRRIAAGGSGVLVYLRGHEGRGIGLINKLRAYGIQDGGADTVEANRLLGFEADSRSYDLAQGVLRDLGVTRIRLLTNNPRKCSRLGQLGFAEVVREPLECVPAAESLPYLRAKRDLLGHLLTGVEFTGPAQAAPGRMQA